jgi:hypothetical protein
MMTSDSMKGSFKNNEDDTVSPVSELSIDEGASPTHANQPEPVAETDALFSFIKEVETGAIDKADGLAIGEKIFSDIVSDAFNNIKKKLSSRSNDNHQAQRFPIKSNDMNDEEVDDERTEEEILVDSENSLVKVKHSDLTIDTQTESVVRTDRTLVPSPKRKKILIKVGKDDSEVLAVGNNKCIQVDLQRVPKIVAKPSVETAEVGSQVSICWNLLSIGNFNLNIIPVDCSFGRRH